MPIIKSAKKRVRQAKKASVLNSKTRKSVRNSVKALQKAIESGDSKSLMDLLSKAQSSIDTAVKKNVIHKNKGSRKKASLAAQVKAAGAKPSKPKTVKKTSEKKPTPKTSKTTAKKPAKKTS